MTISRLVWRGDVVERLVGDAAGEGRVAAERDDVLLAAAQVARRGHAERGGKRRARVARAEAIVLALGAEHEAVEAVGLADGVETVAAAGEQLVDVGLVADVEDEAVGRRVENGMERDGQFHHAEVRPEMAAGLGQHGNQLLANLLGQRGEFLERDFFDVSRGIDRVEEACHRGELTRRVTISKNYIAFACRRLPRTRPHPARKTPGNVVKVTQRA